ncbi:MAG: ABC transporter permease [Clostridium sp.]|nr:ABC transporter permease [Prevotella sp.]MCM1428432.1 ABC transporter permease [Clostridium sp.]MCM1474897.1 ABC transporter permease [Muribaculaceae bacterium]
MLSASLALRFLRSKKSHGAVNAVALVSIIGVAVATAAIICVLSVFNGFREVLTSKLDSLTPDVVVVPADGKTIADGDSLAGALSELKGVELAVPVVEDQALALWDSHEMPITLRGVDLGAYSKLTLLDSLIIAKEDRASEMLAERDILPSTPAVASIGAVAGLGSPMPGEKVLIFAPRRFGRVNMANPVSSFVVDSVRFSSVYESKRSDFDRDVVIVPIQTARDMFMYDTEASYVALKCARGVDEESLAGIVSANVAPSLKVLTRMESQQDNFRMVNIEKWVTFLLLFFILIVAGFNIVSTLSMLVIEKDRQIRILHALGLSEAKIGSVFAWESAFVTIIGGLAGIVLGISLCLAQQHWGFLKLGGDPGNLILTAYPVKVMLSDLIPTIVPLAIIGGITAFSASSFARRRLRI